MGTAKIGSYLYIFKNETDDTEFYVLCLSLNETDARNSLPKRERDKVRLLHVAGLPAHYDFQGHRSALIMTKKGEKIDDILRL
jgi:hypothetical protein